MAENNKLKLLRVLQIMGKTDENHPKNSTQISRELIENYNIGTPEKPVDRKTISNDIQMLNEAGYSINKCENHNDGWYMSEQNFEDYQLKILADLVAFSKFMTIGDSRELIKKIEAMATPDGEKLIKDTLVLDPTIKITDKKFKFKYDTITRAIMEKKQIKFKYGDVEDKNQIVNRKNGWKYVISPYFLVMWGADYYLIGNYKAYTNPSIYKLEMMSEVEATEEKARPISEIEILKNIGKKGGYSIAEYIRENVHAHSGEVHRVTISGENRIRPDVMRKYGNNLMFIDKPDGRFQVSFNVAGTDGLYQWLAKYGVNVKLEGPQEDVEGYKEYIKAVLDFYEK